MIKEKNLGIIRVGASSVAGDREVVQAVLQAQKRAAAHQVRNKEEEKYAIWILSTSD